MPLGSLTALSPARASWHRWRLRPGARARRSRRGARARRGRGGSRRAARALASPSARPRVSGAIVASFRRGANGWTGATSEALVAIETRASTRPPVPRGSCGSPARARVAPRCWAGPRSSRLSARPPPPPPARAFIDLPSRLHNRYFLVRHGESTLETRGLVLSNPSFKYDTTYGLTRAGMAQMHAAARTIAETYDGAPSWLYTSNFQRSFQSALIVREDLGMLFSQLRAEFSGLLDPRENGRPGLQERRYPERGVGRRLA